MNQDVRSAEAADNEISLWELMDQLKSGWQWLISGGAVGLVGAIAFLFFAPTQYEATAMIQPATIGIIAAATTTTTTATTTTTTTTTVEPVAQTLERLKLVTFYDDDTVKVCGVESAKELAASVKVNLVKGNNLLSISYRAESPGLTNTCMSKIVEQLTQSQLAMAAPLIKEFQDQQASTKLQIDDAERFLVQGGKRAASSTASNELSTLMIFKREELMKLQKLYREQRILLTEPLTQPMKLLEPIYVSEQPVAPKKMMVLAGGLVGGLFVGLFVLFVSRGRYRCRAILT